MRPYVPPGTFKLKSSMSSRTGLDRRGNFHSPGLPPRWTRISASTVPHRGLKGWEVVVVGMTVLHHSSLLSWCFSRGSWDILRREMCVCQSGEGVKLYNYSHTLKSRSTQSASVETLLSFNYSSHTFKPSTKSASFRAFLS